MCGHAIESGLHDGRRVQTVFGALEAIQTLVLARILTQCQTLLTSFAADHTSGLPPDIRGNGLGRYASSATALLHPARHFRSRSAEADMVDHLRLTPLSPEAFHMPIQTHVSLYTHEQTAAREMRRDGAADIPPATQRSAPQGVRPLLAAGA